MDEKDRKTQNPTFRNPLDPIKIISCITLLNFVLDEIVVRIRFFTHLLHFFNTIKKKKEMEETLYQENNNKRVDVVSSSFN